MQARPAGDDFRRTRQGSHAVREWFRGRAFLNGEAACVSPRRTSPTTQCKIGSRPLETKPAVLVLLLWRVRRGSAGRRENRNMKRVGRRISHGAALRALAVVCLVGAAADHAVVERALNVFAETVRPDGHIAANVHMNLATGEGHALAGPADPSDETGGTLIGSYFFLFGFGGQQILSELAETYNNDKMLDAIVRHANLYFKYQGETRSLPRQLPRIGQAPYFLAVAYRRTGDERFKNAVEQVIVNGWKGPDLLEIGGDGAGDVRRHLIMTGVERRNKITCSIGEHLHLIPYGYTVFSD